MIKQVLTLSAIAVTTPFALQAKTNQQDKPNMVLFLADDCSYYDLGVYGSKDSKTPNIDRFASEGMLFTGR